MTALACTLPKDSGKPLSRWSSSELVKAAQEKGIVESISPSTIRTWLRQEKIKPWQHRSWQKPTDPRFLERATVVLNLYEKAQELAKAGEIIVCTDEKTCIQALKLTGGVTPASPGRPVRRGDRYKRLGVNNLFAGLLVHTGETLVRFFERKRFEDFKAFLQMVFASVWTRNIRVLHLILDNGPTHASKQIEVWLAGLQLPFEVRIHWLPVHASWLDQVEIVFSPLQRKVLTPRHCTGLPDLEQRVLAYFQEQNRNPKPIKWSYTVAKLNARFSARPTGATIPVLAGSPVVEGFGTAVGGTKTPATTLRSSPSLLFPARQPTTFLTRLGRVIRRVTARGEFQQLCQLMRLNPWRIHRRLY